LEFANNIEKGSFFISYNLGQLYLSMGNLEKAKEFAIRAIQYKENFLEAHDLLGGI
jgi:tetratricopeptide (TPR) repeat protein